MGTKIVDEAGAETGTEAKSDDLVTDDATGEETAETAETTEEETEPVARDTADASGVGQGAAGIVSVALGLVSLTGSWLGTVAQARESLYGQLETAANAGVATQIKQVYADSWNANALVAGFFALAALIVGVVVLVRPAFGDPDRSQAPWIKSVAWAGVSLGFLGLVLAVLKYSDILLGMPTTSG
jgi:VIT1/CCC1 family predicted Fe2+/Mn2+ transporter